MRILITASTFPVSLDDGTPRFIYDLAQALTKHAEVFILAPDQPNVAKHERIGDVDVHRFSYFLPRSLQRLTSAWRLACVRSFAVRCWLKFKYHYS